MNLKLLSAALVLLFAINLHSQDAWFYIGADACVTVKSGAKVNVKGKTVIKADATKAGSLVIDTDAASAFDVTNSSDVEIYLTQDVWHIISPPISDAIINTFLHIYLRRFDETIDPAGGGIYYDNNWIYLSQPVTMPMNVMQGYSVWNQSAMGKNIYTYTGTLNNGQLTNNSLTNSGWVSATPGWNLVGNPYPSSIDVDAPNGWDYMNVDAAMYFWDVSQYKTHMAVGLGGSGIGTIETRYVSPNQGFFVRCNNSWGGYISINNNVRVHNKKSLFKNTKSINDLLKLKVEGNGDKDEVIVYFDTNASPGYDGKYDAYKLYGLLSAPQLYTLTPDNDSIKLSINAVNPDTNILIIPLCLEVGDTGTYVITASELASFKPGVKIFLEDLLTSNITDLTQNPVYSFNADTSDLKLRFLLRFDYQTVSINKPETEKPFYIYSSNRSIYINILYLNENIKVSIFDLLGRKLYNSTITNTGLNDIFFHEHPPSVYIVRLETGTRIFSEKVFVR